MTRVSVIIPTWNRVVETERAVQSVFNQTFQDLEIIVADDGSTDSTSLRFQDYPDPRLHYLRLEHSGLPAVARNAALHMAQGELAAFLDSDDEWLPDKLERQLAVLDHNPEVGMICTNAWIRRGITVESGSYFHTSTIRSQVWPLAELVKFNIVITSSMLVNRQAVISAGEFPQDPIFRAIEDYALWLRLAIPFGLYYLAEPLVIYTDAGNSIRTMQRQEDELKGMMRIFDGLIPLTSAEPAAVKNNLNIRRARFLKSLLKIRIDPSKNEGQWLFCQPVFGPGTRQHPGSSLALTQSSEN